MKNKLELDKMERIIVLIGCVLACNAAPAQQVGGQTHLTSDIISVSRQTRPYTRLLLSRAVGRGNNDLGRGSHDLGRGMLKYKLPNP